GEEPGFRIEHERRAEILPGIPKRKASSEQFVMGETPAWFALGDEIGEDVVLRFYGWDAMRRRNVNARALQDIERKQDFHTGERGAIQDSLRDNDARKENGRAAQSRFQAAGMRINHVTEAADFAEPKRRPVNDNGPRLRRW